jgi:hypothetical protein
VSSIVLRSDYYYTYVDIARFGRIEKANFLWWGRPPRSATEKPEKSSAASDRAGAKGTVFFGKSHRFRSPERLFFWKGFRVKKWAKTQKNRQKIPVWCISDAKKGRFLRGNSAIELRRAHH